MATTAVQAPAGHATTFQPRVAEPSVSTSEPHNVQADLNYYLDTGKPPTAAISGRAETFFKQPSPLQQTIHDVRGREAEYNLDVQGFQFIKHKSAETQFTDEEQIKKVYYPEIEQLLKDATGASRIFIFDHTIRGLDDTVPPADGKPLLRGPVSSVHVDQSYTASRNRVPYHLPDEADRLLQTRHAIINVWRPIRKILKDPLAVSDARTVSDADLVPVPLVYPTHRGETLSVKPNTEHQWYFLYGQDVDEVTLIKCSDSVTDGRARRVPHSAFVDPAHVDDYRRQSIEVRALVFFEDQPAE